MRNRWKPDDWSETLDNTSRLAVAILIVGSAVALVLASIMLAYRIILVP